MKQWEISNKYQISNLKYQINSKEYISHIINILLENRGLKTEKEIDTFLHPQIEDVTIDTVGIDKKQIDKTIKRIKKAIDAQEQIVVFGDYDVDGITGTAILWEALHGLGANVHPYIPHRVDEGYGLSSKGISNVKLQISNVNLIITVDNGIVAHEAVDFANSLGIDVVITDHHTVGDTLPNAHAIVHTTKLCGAGVAYMLAHEISNIKYPLRQSISEASQISNKKEIPNTKYQLPDVFLDLVALATVADLVPLTGANRTLLKFGLPVLQQTQRVGLQELFKDADIIPENIGVYEIGHIIAPRLNAMGRLESAMDSLRLLCTKKRERAQELAHILGETNRGRQLLTQAASLHAIERVKINDSRLKNILILDEEYEEGIIGLVAGKLVEAYYRPAIVISKGEKTSKASARSVSGFNIIEFIRKSSHLLINAGGHPMAAGFTIETEKIIEFKKFLEELSANEVTEEMLIRVLKIDMELPLGAVSQKLYEEIQQLAPFGMGNAEPTFVTKQVIVDDIKFLGREKKHVKFLLCHSGEFAKGDDSRIPLETQRDSGRTSFARMTNRIEAIGFGLADMTQGIKPGDTIDIAYTIDENEWNGRKKLQLKIKDIKFN